DHDRPVPDDRRPVAHPRGATGRGPRPHRPEEARVGAAMAAIEIRQATPADARLLSRLAAQTFTESFGHLYPAEDLEAFLEEAYAPERQHVILSHSDYAVCLMERDGQAIGHAAAGPCGLPHPEVAPGDGEIKRLYMVSDCQGGGLGARLLDVAMAWLLRDG